MFLSFVGFGKNDFEVENFCWLFEWKLFYWTFVWKVFEDVDFENIVEWFCESDEIGWVSFSFLSELVENFIFTDLDNPFLDIFLVGIFDCFSFDTTCQKNFFHACLFEIPF